MSATMQDADQKTSVVSAVEHSLQSVNAIVVLLQREGPLSSDILDLNYSGDVVQDFPHHSDRVVEVRSTTVALDG